MKDLTLHRINKKFEEIKNSNVPSTQKDFMYGDLLRELSEAFIIPFMMTPEWKKDNPQLAELYSRISNSQFEDDL